MLNLLTKIIVFVSIVLAFSQTLAGRVGSLYDVDILVADESTEKRKKAFEQGLDEVFIRISGDSSVMDTLKRPPAGRYVKQFSYEPVNKDSTDEEIDSEDTQGHRLRIQYNGHLMEKYLLENGFASWGQYRPDVVVWLVVRDGRNEYVLKQSDSSLIKKATVEALVRRGIPGQWPLYDKTDRNILNVSDIRGGFKRPVAEASQRYTRGPAITGSMIWNGKQWQSSWSLLLEGESRHWTIDEVDHRRLVNKAVDQAADMLGAKFAVNNATDNQQFITLQLEIQAVNSVEKFRYVENYLASLSMVENIKPVSIDGQNAAFEVSLRSTKEGFLRLLRNDSKLTELEVRAIKPRVTPVTKHEPVKSLESAIFKDVEKTAATTATTDQLITEKVGVEQVVDQTPVYYYRLNQ